MMRYHRDLADVLKRLGASHVHIEPGGRHPRLVGTVSGRELRIVVASSPSSSAAFRSAVAFMRRAVRAAQGVTQ